MLIATIALAVALGQPPVEAPKPDVIDARVGTCSADFTVKDSDGSATILFTPEPTT